MISKLPEIERLQANRDIKRLIAVLKFESNWEARAAAAAALGELADQLVEEDRRLQVVTALRMAIKDTDIGVASTAVAAIIQVADADTAAVFLIEALEDGNWKVRLAASEALKDIYHHGKLSKETKQQLLALEGRVIVPRERTWKTFLLPGEDEGDSYLQERPEVRFRL
jgi:HEAT repeat protein